MEAKERSEQIHRLTNELNAVLSEAADEGLEVWARSVRNERIDAEAVTVLSVSVTRKASA